MHRTVVVVAALCVLSSVAIATNAPGATTAMGTTPPIDIGSEAVPVPASSASLSLSSPSPSPSSPPPSTMPSTIPSTAIGGDRPGAIGPSNPILVTPPGNTTTYLAIGPGNVSNATTTGAALDVGGALAVDAAATAEEIDTLTLDERLSRANTTAAKQAVIRRAGTSIERRIDRLEAGQRASIAAYSERSISTREFVYALARTQTRAEGLREAVDRLETAAASVPGTAIGGESVDSWARDRRVELGVLTSPLRERIVGALRGTGPVEVFVEVSDTGVVLATIDRGQYVRDVFLPSARNDGSRDGPGSTSAALDRVSERYSWAWNHTTGVESAGGPAAGSYRITIFHQHGGLTTYLDPRTGSVFREIQVKRLGAVPTTAAVNATRDGLWVGVRRTHATGPMNVSVVDSRTREPINATVLVDNRTVGRTGAEGYLWAMTPRGTVNVTVIDDDRSVTARFTANPRSTGTDGTASGGSPTTPSVGLPTATDDGSTPPANRSTDAGNATATTAADNATAVVDTSNETIPSGSEAIAVPDPEPSGRR